MNYNELDWYANTIPSMGGRQLKEQIFRYVENLKEERSVVELGTWMGAGAAQIILALLYYGKNNPIYTYDKFIVSGRQPMKALKAGWEIQKGDDMYKIAKDILKPFECNITVIKGVIQDMKYKREEIGLYIDDAVKQEERFIKTLKNFSPYFVPGETICIFMDYYLFEKTENKKHKFQYNFMQEHRDNFELLEDRVNSTYLPEEGKDEGAVFLYKGGLEL